DALVHTDFGKCLVSIFLESDFSREGYERLHVGIPFRFDVFVEAQLVSHCMLARTGHYHGLCPATDLVAGMGAGVLHDYLNLLRYLIVVEGNKTSQRSRGLTAWYFRVILHLLDQLVITLVAGVVGQHVMDKALFNGLPHTVVMERSFAVSSWLVEHGHGLELGGSGEREKAQVRLFGTFELL